MTHPFPVITFFRIKAPCRMSVFGPIMAGPSIKAVGAMDTLSDIQIPGFHSV